MTRYVIYTPTDGIIRAIMTGDRELAELNIRAGEAMIEHDGYVNAAEHRVDTGTGLVVSR